MKLRTWLQGAGVAALILFVFYRDLIETPGEIRIHAPISVSNMAFSLIVNLVIASLLFMLLGNWLHKTSRWAWLRLFVPALILASLFEVVYIARNGWGAILVWNCTFVIVAISSFLLHWIWPRREKWLLQLSGATLIGLGFYCIFVVLQLLHLALWRQGPSFSKATLPISNSANDRPRVVWILFDELSYQQVFGDRYPNLELPNFDELRTFSTLFTNVKPIINETEKAVPSILLGQTVTRINYTSNNQLQVGSATGPLQPFDSGQTPFALARHLGLTTGVVGWYNPYCSILRRYLNQCYWTDEALGPQAHGWKDFLRKLFYPWIVYGTILNHPTQLLSKGYRAHVVERLMEPATALYRTNRVYVYRELMQRGQQILEPSGPDFVFLHLSIPHPPGFYNRKTLKFVLPRGQSSYVDNLALADKALGQLLTVLQQSPRWKNTSVVVCGDHSWRTYMWSRDVYWSPEDEAASHGRVFDPRPALMVHLAGQTTPATVNEPFPLLKVHDILDDLIQGKQPTFSPTSH